MPLPGVVDHKQGCPARLIDIKPDAVRMKLLLKIGSQVDKSRGCVSKVIPEDRPLFTPVAMKPGSSVIRGDKGDAGLRMDGDVFGTEDASDRLTRTMGMGGAMVLNSPAS
jgi:hypothetical protein